MEFIFNLHACIVCGNLYEENDTDIWELILILK